MALEVTTQCSKAQLREVINRKWLKLSDDARLVQSKKLSERLKRYLNNIEAKNVLFYAAMDDEPLLDPLLEVWMNDSTCNAVLVRSCTKTKQLDPRLVFRWDDLQQGLFGIREPLASCPEFDLASLDVIIIPGRAFDREGNRLGRGYGFYDRFLSVISKDVVKIGVALDFQIHKDIPTEDHDVAMNVVITDKNLFLPTDI